jgi:hypothetical protein
MANTHTWDVEVLQREHADGYVKQVSLLLTTATDTGGTETSQQWVELEKPDTLVPYADITKAQALSWAKTKLGDTEVQAAEDQADARLAESGATTYGVPW